MNPPAMRHNCATVLRLVAAVLKEQLGPVRIRRRRRLLARVAPMGYVSFRKPTVSQVSSLCTANRRFELTAERAAPPEELSQACSGHAAADGHLGTEPGRIRQM